MFIVYATNEQDARDIGERRARDARLRPLVVDECTPAFPNETGMRRWVVYVTVAER